MLKHLSALFIIVCLSLLTKAQDIPTFLWQYDNMVTPTKFSWSYGFEMRPLLGKRIALSYPFSIGTHYGQKRLYIHTTGGFYTVAHVIGDSTIAKPRAALSALAMFIPESVGVYIGPDVNPYLHLSLGFAGVDYWKTFGKPREDTRYTLSFGVQYIPRDQFGWRTVIPFIKVFNGTSFNNGVNEWGVRFGVSFVPDTKSRKKALWFMPAGD